MWATDISPVTQDVWLRTHPYLQSVADLHALVDAAAVRISPADAAALRWEDYGDEVLRGAPLLHSSIVMIDYAPVEKIVRSLVESMAASPPTDKLAVETRTLSAELNGDPHAARPVVAWLLGDNAFASACPGLLRYLGWTVLSRYLRSLTDAFSNWRDDERWLRTYCPTCGSPPAMAQLVGVDQGRQRFLSCGCCRTRWRYKRTGCPFCENGDDRRLAVVVAEGEGGLRIDSCESCKGYLKTYDGEGSETVLLADWTSIHLDVIACDRGLKRLAASLYDL